MKRRTFFKKLGGLLVIPIVGKELLKSDTDNGKFPLMFTNNNTEILRVEFTGNVGMGTTSPNIRLHGSNDICML